MTVLLQLVQSVNACVACLPTLLYSQTEKRFSSVRERPPTNGPGSTWRTG